MSNVIWNFSRKHNVPYNELVEFVHAVQATRVTESQPQPVEHDAAKERPAVNDFAHWLNKRRDLPVAEVFHDVVQCYRAVIDALDLQPVQAKKEE